MRVNEELTAYYFSVRKRKEKNKRKKRKEKKVT